jgi:hypothetical protein
MDINKDPLALTPKRPRVFACFESKPNSAKLELVLVFPIVRSCSKLLCLCAYQILHSHSLPFVRS